MAEPRKTITALRKAGRASVVVELDGAPWRRLPTEVIVACSLRPGLELDRARLRRLRAELRRTEALATAGRLLRHRDLAAGRLEHELERRGVASAQRSETLGALRRTGIVDDRRLATTRADALAERGYGDEAIRWRLSNDGIGDALVEDAVAALEPELARAQEILGRDGLSDRTLRGLVRRGFSEETVESVAPIADLGG